MKIILHIGRHKTGTSSLQRFLDKNSDALASIGVLYPRSGRRGVGHHPIAEVLSRKNLRLTRTEAMSRAIDLVAEIRAELRENHHTVIISSEAFQNADPQAVREIFAPWTPVVIAYLREQYQYLVSAYQQKVHAQAYSAELKVFLSSFNPDYLRFLEEWEAAFGRSNLDVGIFEKDRLISGNIVVDFMERIGLSGCLHWDMDGKDANPSIGGSLLELKRLINRECGEGKVPQKLYAEMGKMVAESPLYSLRPILSTVSIDAFMKKFEAGNEAVLIKYFPQNKSLFSAKMMTSDQLISRDELIDGMLIAASELKRRAENWQNRTSEDSRLLNVINEFSTSRLGIKKCPPSSDESSASEIEECSELNQYRRG